MVRNVFFMLCEVCVFWNVAKTGTKNINLIRKSCMKHWGSSRLMWWGSCDISDFTLFQFDG